MTYWHSWQRISALSTGLSLIASVCLLSLSAYASESTSINAGASATAAVPSIGNLSSPPTPADATIDATTVVANVTSDVAITSAYYASNLLDSISAEFHLPVELNKRTQQQLNWYVRNPAYLDRVFERSQRYLPYIVEEIRKRNMPLELALLPVVESAFDPFAYSHGRAAGLWQFIPSTAKMFGLKQNWWYDGRRDPVDSTRAALDYLQHLHQRLDGDWLHAVAAYNSGEGRVRSAVRRNKKKGLETDFWNLKLPRETSAYVPKLLAISHVVKNYWQYNLQLPFVSDQPFFSEVDTGGQIDLALVADLAGIDVQEIYKLNSGFNQWATAPQGPHRLMVPFDVAPLLQDKLHQLTESDRIQWKRVKIANGDTLSTIAQKHGTTVSTLKTANSISGTSIRAGKYLLIPTRSKDSSQYSLSSDMRQARLLNSSSSSKNVIYKVKSGDSFWSIATAHGVGTRQLARWNAMAPGDTLSIGKSLVIKNPGKKSTTRAVTSASPDGTRRKIRYTVRRGDSLSTISSRFRVSVAQLRKWNTINQKYLQPGQKLNLYVDVTKQSGG